MEMWQMHYASKDDTQHLNFLQIQRGMGKEGKTERKMLSEAGTLVQK